MAKHHPKHYYLNDTVYFITAHIYQKKTHLSDPRNKELLLNIFRKILDEFNFQLLAWVILDNHYHIQFKTKSGDDLVKAMRRIHINCAYSLNKLEKKEGRKLFQNFWDTCIRNKDEFYRYFNYIHYNPVKHGIVEEMSEYPFSSFHYWQEQKGKSWLASCFDKFPIEDFHVKYDEFSD